MVANGRDFFDCFPDSGGESNDWQLVILARLALDVELVLTKPDIHGSVEANTCCGVYLLSLTQDPGKYINLKIPHDMFG